MNTVVCRPFSHGPIPVRRSLKVSRRRREKILAALAFLTLIIAWDATLRLDEHIAPTRLRTSHAVELEAEAQTATLVP